MKLINRGRGTGKTTQLLYTSATTNYPIITVAERQGEYLERLAEKLGLKIPKPITFRRFNPRFLPPGSKILVDNLEFMLSDILKDYFKTEVCAATISHEDTFPTSTKEQVKEEFSRGIGKRLDNGEWEYGYIFEENDKCFIATPVPSVGGSIGVKLRQIDPETLVVL